MTHRAHRSLDESVGRNLITRRAIELLGLVMIGDGVLTFARPRRHVQLWHAGPRVWRQMMKPFEEHPELTRWLGLAEAAAGCWLALQQDDARRW